MYFLLALVYYAAFNATIYPVPTSPNEDVAPEFTIHGLWPEYSNGSWPQFCTKCYWKNIPESPIQRKMLYYWSNMWVGPTNRVAASEKLWHHEFCRHGTCFTKNDTRAAAQLNQQMEFLNTAISAYQYVKPESLFTEISHGRTYRVDEIESALETLNTPGYPVCKVLGGRETMVGINLCLCMKNDQLRPCQCTRGIMRDACRGRFYVI